jgi:hypothetical protein
MSEVELIQVVRTRLLRRGKGILGDPVRIITQYWSVDGELLAEVDPTPPGTDVNTMGGTP